MKASEKVKLKEEYQFWKDKLAEFESQLPETKSQLFVLQGEEIRGKKDSVKLAEAQTQLADLQQKISACYEKLEGIEGVLEAEAAKELDNEITNITNSRAELEIERLQAATEAGKALSVVHFYLNNYYKTQDRFIQADFGRSDLHVNKEPSQARQAALSGYAEETERLKTEQETATTFWARDQHLRGLDSISRGTHKVREEEIKSRVGQFLRS